MDRYRRGTSLVHCMDPRLKLLATLGFVAVATTLPSRAWMSFALLAIIAVGSTLASQIPLLAALKHSAVVLPFAGMVAVSLPFTRTGQTVWSWHPLGTTLAVSDEGLILFAAVLIKAWLSILVSQLLVGTTPFPELLKSLRILRVPAILTATMSFMYRYIFVLVDEAMRLQTARAARSAGAGRTSLLWRARVLGGMIGSLFIRSYERSERIYTAMLSRGFAGEVRTLTRPVWKSRDSWLAVSWAAALIGVSLVGRVLL
jgi:cobalt/nickel transport system permease protein